EVLAGQPLLAVVGPLGERVGPLEPPHVGLRVARLDQADQGLERIALAVAGLVTGARPEREPGEDPASAFLPDRLLFHPAFPLQHLTTRGSGSFLHWTSNCPVLSNPAERAEPSDDLLEGRLARLVGTLVGAFRRGVFRPAGVVGLWIGSDP